MVNYKSIVKNLQKHYSDANEVVVVGNKGKVIYSTSNWSVSKDIKTVLASWGSGSAQFVNMNGIRYSVLQMSPERFIATNRKKKGHLVGSSIFGSDLYIIAHIKPKAKGWIHMAYPAVTRAAAMMKKGSKSQFVETEVDVSVENEIIAKSSSMVQPTIDPYLKAEVEGFVDWINNPQGLTSYLLHSLQENDPYRISKLAELYNELYILFYG
jgi:predicted regulator of Ras-like GTPase activity (Roadblock/LC7/MglB family)